MTNATTVPGGLEAREPASRPERTPAEIEAEIERTRARLAGTVDAIAERVKPANVARRGVDSAKAQVVDERGNLRVAAGGRARGRARRGRRADGLATIPLTRHGTCSR